MPMLTPKVCGSQRIFIPMRKCYPSYFVGVEDAYIDPCDDFDLTCGVYAYDGLGRRIPYTYEPSSIDTCEVGEHVVTYYAKNVCAERTITVGEIQMRTVLYTDGTLIINEPSTKMAENIALHGVEIRVYPPLDADHDYVFASKADVLWHDECASVVSTEMGSRIAPTNLQYWYADMENLVHAGFNDIDFRNIVPSVDGSLRAVDGDTWYEYLTELDFSNAVIYDDVWMQHNNYYGGLYEYVPKGQITSVVLTNVDTSHVTSFDRAFEDFSSVASLDVTSFDTSNATIMSSMFANCFALVSLDVTDFDTSNVTDMRAMFGSCYVLTGLDVTGFDTSKVTDMNTLFGGCSELTSLDVSNFDTSKVTDMSSMFGTCKGLSQLDLSNFVTSNVVYMDSMFSGCSGFTSLDLSSFDTSKVTSMHSMFRRCTNVIELTVCSFDTSNVEEMVYMFGNCTSLVTIYASPSFVTTAVTDGSDMFLSDSDLVGGAGTTYSSYYRGSSRAKIDGGVGNEGYFTACN